MPKSKETKIATDRMCPTCGFEWHGTADDPAALHKCVVILKRKLGDLQHKHARLEEAYTTEVIKPTVEVESSSEKHIHVDDWVDRFDTGKQSAGEKYARWFFFLHRLAAVYQSDWRRWINQFKLFCTYQGQRYRVTGASRMGDIWLARDPLREVGYDKRVYLNECSEWSDQLALHTGTSTTVEAILSGKFKTLPECFRMEEAVGTLIGSYVTEEDACKLVDRMYELFLGQLTLQLTDEEYDQTLQMLSVLRKNNVKVSVMSEELACLMHSRRDNKNVAETLCKKMEWLQDLFNSGEYKTLPGFPADEFWGGLHPDTMKLWIENLLKIVKRVARLRDDVVSRNPASPTGLALSECLFKNLDKEVK